MVIKKVKHKLFINSLDKMRVLRKALKNNLSNYTPKDYKKIKVKLYLNNDNE